MNNERSLKFNNNSGRRYWWFNIPENNYIPPIYSFLKDEEWDIIEEWYQETDEKNLIAECNVSLMCVLQGFVMGNGISRILQFGTSVGYSTLLFGFMLRHMDKKNSLVTIDIDEVANNFTKKYIKKSSLEDYVKVITADSSDPSLPEECIEYLKGNPQIVLIDSSHQYEHTLRELNLWYNHLMPNALIFMHDTSIKAKEYDSTGKGGVSRALSEWTIKNDDNRININKSITIEATKDDLIYLDGCGVGIIQKI